MEVLQTSINHVFAVLSDECIYNLPQFYPNDKKLIAYVTAAYGRRNGSEVNQDVERRMIATCCRAISEGGIEGHGSNSN